ncbi:MAG: NADH-quinone oxidoreductase subunit NuoE [Alphaproteobacteria bacterium]|nr:NADH-quinone oxidoreductase subunit NuoE [Alphaproteobacteria bacterium]
MKPKFEPNAKYQPKEFTFKSKKKVKNILANYPSNQARSGIMPLLDLAQRQMGEEGAKAKKPFGGWITRAAMDHIAEVVGQPPMKVYEVATFYSMYNLAPVGKNLVQFCTTTQCWLCGSTKILEAAEKHLKVKIGESTKDGLFTLKEVECLGACVNGPMIQINDDYYEDLTAETMVDVLIALTAGKKPNVGSQTKRHGSMALSGPTSLEKEAKKAGVV